MNRQRSPYEYTALDNTKRQVRLVHQHPFSETGAEKISDTEDDEANVIHSLSYVWGDPRVTTPIDLHGHPFPVTSNLFSALKHLRLRDTERVLWVDALCINQDDNRERSSQVPYMRHIYSQATAVLIFLGEAWEGSNVVIGLIKTLATKPFLHLDPRMEPSVMSHGFNLEDFDLLQYIPAQETVFICGEDQFYGAWLKPFEHCMLGHSGCCNTARQLSHETPEGQSIAAGLQRASLLDDTGMPDGWGWSHFASVLASFRSRDSSNPLDKVYGLLGLGDDALRAGLRVDYDRLPGYVYTDVVITTINERKDLDVLSLVYGPRQPAQNIPSFVPDFATAGPGAGDINYFERYMKFLKTFSASNETEADIFTVEEGELSVRAMLVDEILEVQPSENATWKQVTEIGRKFANQIERMDHPYDSIFETFRKTMCGGIAYFPHILDLVEPVDSTYLPIYEKWQSWVDSGMPVLTERDVVNFSLAFQIAFAGRLLAITKGGRMGLVPYGTVPGDIAAIMPGGKVPYVLSQAPEESSKEESKAKLKGRYRFLGEAYIHGVMFGEAWGESKLVKLVIA
ncbi:hypothetical protein EJ07DRAFT_162712 [Lizonia empirigonia]|nr:hypothetical protein EJ07DRAFT_162712 [Lizonia empirigonia]